MTRKSNLTPAFAPAAKQGIGSRFRLVMLLAANAAGSCCFKLSSSAITRARDSVKSMSSLAVSGLVGLKHPMLDR